MSRLRAIVRHGALDVLSAGYRLTDRQATALVRPRVHLPYLHAVPPHEEEAFRRFVAALAVDHEFITYSDAVEKIRTGDYDRPYVSFSFDDGFVSNIRAAEILEEFGAVGMFFVPAGFVGIPTVDEARQFFGFTDGCDEPAMTWDDLESLRARGHEIGNHTWGHQILSSLSPQQAYEEVASAHEEFGRRLGECQHFAWPYGRFRDFTDSAARAVFETGHTSCASAERGAHTVPAGEDPAALCLRRDHIMTKWPLRHCTYFVAHSSAVSGPAANAWPDSWEVRA